MIRHLLSLVAIVALVYAVAWAAQMAGESLFVQEASPVVKTTPFSYEQCMDKLHQRGVFSRER